MGNVFTVLLFRRLIFFFFLFSSIFSAPPFTTPRLRNRPFRSLRALSRPSTQLWQSQAQHVEIEDLSGGCGQAFMAIIVSPQFESKNMLARHRLVNAALKEEIAAIHAWTPKCYTPEQWQSLMQQ